MAGELTKIQIGATAYDLNRISAADAAKLYDALGTVTNDKGEATLTNYQQLADQVAAVVVNYQSIVSVTLPADMSPMQATQNLMDALKEGSGKLADTSAEYLKQMMDTPFGKSIQENGLYKTADGIASVMGSIGAFGSGFSKGLMLPVTAYKALKEGSKDAINYLDGKLNPISAEEAKSIGAVYAAAVYSSTEAPHAPAESKRKDISEAGTWTKVSTWLQDKGAHIWEFLSTGASKVFKFCTNGFDWSKASAEVDAENATKEPLLSYEQRLEKQLNSHSNEAGRASASEILAQVEEVAGRGTKNLSTLVKNGGIYRDNDGKWNSLTFDEKGMPKTSAVDIENPEKAGTNHKYAMVGGIAAGGYVTTQAGIGLVKGMTSQIVGSNSLPMKAIDKELKTANTLMEKSEIARNGKPAGKHFWQREVAPNAAKADKLLVEAQEAVAKVDVDKIAANAAKAEARTQALSTTKVGEKILDIAESKPTNFLQKVGNKCGQAWGWCLEKVGVRSAEKVIATVETVGVNTATRTVAKAVPLLNIVPEAVDMVSSAATTGMGSHQTTKAAASLSIVGSATAIGFGIGSVVPVVGNVVGAGIGACVGGIISWFSAEPIADAVCGKPGDQTGTATGAAAGAAAPAPAPTMDAGLQAANLQAQAQLEQAQRDALRSGQTFAINGITANTKLGAVNELTPQPVGAPAAGQNLYLA